MQLGVQLHVPLDHRAIGAQLIAQEAKYQAAQNQQDEPNRRMLCQPAGSTKVVRQVQPLRAGTRSVIHPRD